MAANSYATLSDVELLGQIALKNRDALEAFYEKYSGPVYSLAMQMLRDQGAAQEVTQDTFFKVWQKGSTYRPDRGKATAWLFSIAHHRVIDEVRRRKRHQEARSGRDVETVDHPSDESTDPTKYATLQMERGRLKDALSYLRPEQREVVVLAYYGGLTHSEIATKLEQPLGTVKTRMRLGLKKLREVLGTQDQEWAEYGL